MNAGRKSLGQWPIIVALKRTAITLLAVLGALTLVALALPPGGSSLTPNHESIARAEFGTPDAIADLVRLFTRVEDDGASLTPQESHTSSVPALHLRKIPRSWLPERFGAKWAYVEADGMVNWNDVLAYYNERDQLLGLEFYGSRYGCFVSRDAMRCPPWFTTVHRITDTPLFVSLRLTAGE